MPTSLASPAQRLQQSTARPRATAAADTGNLRFYQRQGFRMRSVERDAFSTANGYPPRLQVDGILATMYDGRTLHSREVVRSVVDHFGDRVFHTVISRTVKFPDATLAAEPITAYAPTHSGADAYRQLAKEVLTRWPAE